MSDIDLLAALMKAKDDEIAYLRQQNADLLRRVTELAQPGGNARIAAALQERAATRTALQAETVPPVNRPPQSFSPRVLSQRRVDVPKSDDPRPRPEDAAVADERARDIERTFGGRAPAEAGETA